MMHRHVVTVFLICLLIAACGSTPVPSERQTVTLIAPSGGTDVPLIRDYNALLPEEIARIPSGAECFLVKTTRYVSGHGGQVVDIYQVDCDGAVGWAEAQYVVTTQGQSGP